VGLDETLIDGMKSVLIYLSIGVSILLSAIGILHSLREWTIAFSWPLSSIKIWDINVLGKAETQRQMALTLSGEKADFVFHYRLASGEIRLVQVYSGAINSGSWKKGSRTGDMLGICSA